MLTFVYGSLATNDTINTEAETCRCRFWNR